MLLLNKKIVISAYERYNISTNTVSGGDKSSCSQSKLTAETLTNVSDERLPGKKGEKSDPYFTF